jgi:hypothetical protein
MSKRPSMMVLLGALSLTAACGSDHSATDTDGVAGTGGTASTADAATTGDTAGTGGTAGTVDAAADARTFVLPPCINGENAVCHPSGFPFVGATFPNSDWCNGAMCLAAPPDGGMTIRLSQPETGTLCLSGTAKRKVAGFTSFIMLFVEQDRSGTIVNWLNADVLGITQVRFTVDRPPPGGVSVWATTVKKTVGCAFLPDCLTFGFNLPQRITESGTTTASWADFDPDSGPRFDARALGNIGFDVFKGDDDAGVASLDYDFCVRDFQFLDANGVEVKAITP